MDSGYLTCRLTLGPDSTEVKSSKASDQSWFLENVPPTPPELESGLGLALSFYLWEGLEGAFPETWIDPTWTFKITLVSLSLHILD